MSTKKQQGYVIEESYPRFFYPQMTPLWLTTVVNCLGFIAPCSQDQFAYLELGCATGTNLLICAATYPHANFVGVDFNPSHIQAAQQAALALGLSNVQFIQADFAEFLAINNQQFDFIVNHGTYSWIGKPQQQQITNIVATALKPQGIFYLHYMCYPGSADLSTIQKLCLMVDQAQRGSSAENLNIAKNLCFDLQAAGAFVHHAQVDAALKTLQHSDAYLMHEFLTEHWQPLYSVDVHQALYEQANLSYVGSADPCANIETISIPARLQSLIKTTKDPALKEYLKDIARHAKQRIDVFQRQPQAYSSEQHLEQLQKMQFKLLPNIPQTALSVFHTPIGAIQADANLMQKLCAALAKRAYTFAELLQWPEFKGQLLFLLETLFLLMNAQYVHPYFQSSTDVIEIERFEAYFAAQGLRLKWVSECGTAKVLS